MKTTITKKEIAALGVEGVARMVKNLLGAIEEQKRRATPDKKEMRELLRMIQFLRREDDYRNTYTGQDAKFLMHTSVRGWRDDI